MPITLANGRQAPLVASVDFTYADLVDNTAEPAVQLPANAIVVAGGLTVTTVWNSATTDVIDIGDGGTANRYTPTPIDVAVLGYVPIDVSGYKYTVSDTVDIKWNGTGTAPTTGAARLQIWYIVEGRAMENQPVRL